MKAAEMQYLPLATFLGFVIGAILASYITRAYWLEKVKETHNHWRAHMLELQSLALTGSTQLRACELCRHSLENRDTGAPVMVCLHRQARMARGPSPCALARSDALKCGPDARLWESRAEALERVRATLASADPSAWQGDGPAPAWWYDSRGRKVYRDARGQQ